MKKEHQQKIETTISQYQLYRRKNKNNTKNLLRKRKKGGRLFCGCLERKENKRTDGRTYILLYMTQREEKEIYCNTKNGLDTTFGLYICLSSVASYCRTSHTHRERESFCRQNRDRGRRKKKTKAKALLYRLERIFSCRTKKERSRS